MSYSDDSDYRDSDSEEEVDLSSEKIKSFLRLRPMNKLEASRRSKNCVEFHDDPRVVTVDSPLEGEFDFGFDRVFDQYSSQAEVFEHAVSPVAGKLLEGYNCSVMAYGQTGTGKTHTMMGQGTGSLRSPEMKSKVEKRGVDQVEDEPESSVGVHMDAQDQGMIPRTINSLFSLMEKSSPTVEYTVRCSYVEIYLEKILDLLRPQGLGDVALNIADDGFADEAAGGGGKRGIPTIEGAAELCCIDEKDVLSLLDRGNACRTVSSTNMNTDSSRSHAVFILKIEQRDDQTGEGKKSVLHMIDFAGSEMAGTTPQFALSQQSGPSAVQAEAKMINKSLSALTNVVRAQMKRQKGAKMPIPSESRRYKLTRLLSPCFGENCLTYVICTASPSSYNIGETISAIRFGQCCRQIRNPVVVNTEYTPEFYKKRLARSERQQSELKMLVKALAAECQSLKSEGAKGPLNADLHSGPLWDNIEEVLNEDDGGDSDYVVVVRRAGETGSEGQRSKLSESRIDSNPALEAGDSAEIAELQSEVAVLRTQNESLSAESKKVVQELIDAKNEIQVVSQRKIEVEHNLRTSQFRENEATVFLRQFRRFYRRLLKNKAAQGSGETQEITAKTPGVPDLTDLIDVDTLLVESGLIEEEEMHDESTAGTYRPSSAALLRSTAAAKKASKQRKGLERESSGTAFSSSAHSETSEEECSHMTSSSANESESRIGTDMSQSHQLDMISEIGDGGVSGHARDRKHENGGGADAGAGAGASVDPLEGSDEIRTSSRSISGASVAERQRALRTPSGRLIAIKEKELEQDFLKMTEKCVELQLALDNEREKYEALANRGGAFGKKRDAQEAVELRQQLDRKTHDLQAIIWKMNELHLINKTYNDKMANREQHVSYLEENLADLQNSNKRLMKERQESETRLREELENMRALIDGVTVPLWQFGEEATVERPVASRIILPVIIGERKSSLELDFPARRMSDGASEASLDSDGRDVAAETARTLDTRKDSNTNLTGVGDNPLLARKIELLDAETQTEEVERVPEQPPTVKVETSEIAIQTDSLPEPPSAQEIIAKDANMAARAAAVAATLTNGAGIARDIDTGNDSFYDDDDYESSEERVRDVTEGGRLSRDDTGHSSSDEDYLDHAKTTATIEKAAKAFSGEDDDHARGVDTPNRTTKVERKLRASFSSTRDLKKDRIPVDFPNPGERKDVEKDFSDPVDGLYAGGKPSDYTPRQFVEKLGPSIKSGILKDSTRKPKRHDSRRRLASQSSRSKNLRSKEDKKKKKKKSSKASRDGDNRSKSRGRFRRDSSSRQSGSRPKRSKSVF